LADLNDIVRRLEPSLGPLEGEPSALDGGITNRNFRVTLGAREYVIRLPGKDTSLLGIDRDAERIAAQAAAALGIAPAVAIQLEDCLVTEFVTCSALDAGELERRVAEVAGALRAFHRSGTRLPRRFWIPDLLVEYAGIVSARGDVVGDDFERAIAVAERVAAALEAGEACACHNDLLAGNIIRSHGDGRLMLVDWEYAGMGHPYFDLGNLSVNNGLGEDGNERLLSAYHGERPSPARRATLQLMRILSDAREAAWGVVQAGISQLDFNFDAYAARHFARMLQNAGAAGFEEWLALAGGGVDAESA
jgi:thiamine kinase-like enzyme